MWNDNLVFKMANYALTEEWAAKMCKEGKDADWRANKWENMRFYPIAFMKHKTVEGKVQIEDKELPDGIFISAPHREGIEEPVLLRYISKEGKKELGLEFDLNELNLYFPTELLRSPEVDEYPIQDFDSVRPSNVLSYAYKDEYPTMTIKVHGRQMKHGNSDGTHNCQNEPNVLASLSLTKSMGVFKVG